jgi:alkylhydroperoxidase/carboxymuconolactone decarboxylase family protein YurZ
MRRTFLMLIVASAFAIGSGAAITSTDALGHAGSASSELGAAQEAAADIAAVTAPLGGVFDSIHAFNAPTQRFDLVTATGPAFLNTLDTVRAGEGVWLFSNGSTLWQQPVLT